MTERLLRVSAPHFVAGSIWRGHECVKAAPILKWMVGKPAAEIKAYLDRKKWQWEWI